MVERAMIFLPRLAWGRSARKSAEPLFKGRPAVHPWPNGDRQSAYEILRADRRRLPGRAGAIPARHHRVAWGSRVPGVTLRPAPAPAPEPTPTAESGGGLLGGLGDMFSGRGGRRRAWWRPRPRASPVASPVPSVGKSAQVLRGVLGSMGGGASGLGGRTPGSI